MGCFNATDFVTRQTIMDGEPIKFFMLEKPEYGHQYGDVFFEPNEIFSPVCLPLTGTYDDYGRVENIRNDLAYKLTQRYLAKKLKMKVKDNIIKAISHRKIDGYTNFFWCMTPVSVYNNMTKHKHFDLEACTKSLEDELEYDREWTRLLNSGDRVAKTKLDHDRIMSGIRPFKQKHLYNKFSTPGMFVNIYEKLKAKRDIKELMQFLSFWTAMIHSKVFFSPQMGAGQGWAEEFDYSMIETATANYKAKLAKELAEVEDW